jgi:hypothetical protein
MCAMGLANPALWCARGEAQALLGAVVVGAAVWDVHSPVGWQSAPQPASVSRPLVQDAWRGPPRWEATQKRHRHG